MGSQESTNVQNFLNTEEGKSIDKISHSSFEQNIYVCGNYDINFFKENIIDNPKDPRPDITSYIKMSKHKQIKEWYFFFAPKITDFDKIEKNTKEFINDHNDEEVFDDFEEGSLKSLTRYEKTTIIYFNDENKDKFLDYFLNKHNQYLLPFIIFVGKKDENNELKSKILKGIKELKKEIDPNIFKYTNVNDKIENSLINLNLNLIECAAFYNELGDEFKFPKKCMDEQLMQNDLNEILKNFATFNILICGRPGVGKSTFINFMIKTMVCKASSGKECSSKIIKYIHRTLPITFYDTPGISTEEKIKSVIELIKIKNKELKDSKSKIHAVFYVLSALDPRSFMNFEREMFNFILQENHLPVYFILTKLTDLKKAEENLPIIIKNYKDVTKDLQIDLKYKKHVDEYIFWVNVIGESIIGVDKLFEKVYKDFKDKIRPERINNNNISQVTRNSLIGEIYKPQDIISHPKKMCEHITLIYRLVARSISSNEKGATFLSAAFLKIIFNIFGIKDITIEECKRMIKSLGFKIDIKNRNEKKNFSSWFVTRFYNGYQTPAEEEISFLANKYINDFKNELENDNQKCIDYINKLRIALNESIEGLNQISLEYKKN